MISLRLRIADLTIGGILSNQFMDRMVEIGDWLGDVNGIMSAGYGIRTQSTKESFDLTQRRDTHTTKTFAIWFQKTCL